LNYPGQVIYRDGSILNRSGGRCYAPNRCTGCNDGFYADDSTGTCKGKKKYLFMAIKPFHIAFEVRFKKEVFWRKFD